MAAKAKAVKVAAPKMSWKRDFQRNWPIYLLFLPIFIYTLVLSYTPLVGLLMAFENYVPTKGLFGSQWVGMQNFIDLFTGEEFLRALRNTVIIATLKCTIGFIMPVAFALVLSLVKNKLFKRITQTFSYMPNFIAAVVVVALVQEFLSDHGAITMFLSKFGLPVQNWLANPDVPVFWVIYLVMGIWQGVGWGSIMYVSAIATVSGDLHEAAAIDGATRLQRLFKITLPCIKPMVIMMMVVNVGTSFIAGFDTILLMYLPSTYEVADTLYTYTYRMAFSAGASNYGLSTASGLFQSIVATTLLIGSNTISRKMGESSLF
jgi:ABC-type polysaccharide transport system permease subunit